MPNVLSLIRQLKGLISPENPIVSLPTPAPRVDPLIARGYVQSGNTYIGPELARQRGLTQGAVTSTPIATPQASYAPVTDIAPGRWATLVDDAARQSGIPPAILASLLQTESHFNPEARSPAGATGIAQFMPGTARGLGVDPNDPVSSIYGAARYLKSHYDKYNDWDKAVAAYNAGGAAVNRYGGVPPYPETQNYVQKVLGGARGE